MQSLFWQNTIFVIAVIVLLTAASRAGEAAELTLNLEPEVIEDTVYLSDLFDGVPLEEDVSVARAPAPGEEDVYTAMELRALAERAGQTWANSERIRRVTLIRASQQVTAGEIEDLVERALITDGYGDRFQVDLSNRNYTLNLPYDASRDIAIADLRMDSRTGYFDVTISAAALDGETETLRGRALQVLEIPVLANMVDENQLIRESDVTFIDMPINRVNQGIVVDARDLIGQAPRRNVRIGQPVRSRDIGPQILAERGARVRVAYQVPGMQLTVVAEAMEDGALGDVIRLRNTATNMTIEAEIVGPGQARSVTTTELQTASL